MAQEPPNTHLNKLQVSLESSFAQIDSRVATSSISTNEAKTTTEFSTSTIPTSSQSSGPGKNGSSVDQTSVYNEITKEESSMYTENDVNESSENQGNFLLTKKQLRIMFIKRFGFIIVVDALLPIGLYYILKSHMLAVWALVVSTAPVVASVIIQAIFLRRIDPIGLAVVFGFILSVILAVVDKDPKLLLMRESFVLAGVGGICALTLIPIRYKSFELRPFTYYIAIDIIPMRQVTFQDPDKEPQKRIAFYWVNSPFCRFHVRVLTAVIIVFLEAEFGLKLFYIFTFDIDKIVILSNSTLPAIAISVAAFAGFYIYWIGKKLQKLEPEMMKAAGAIH
ncbi:hypothetical protein J3Q64DRAFT_1771596 [Phycomyces blakesleeanus]|uniref:Uncharacterized protein n=2 Tax=Phycomyces blakesleeanus TaxID=4837 RepID=A0A167JB14_PHYB8|nr:hypothetical protein PHYBLDRAFT_176016 [Phycomyces blakesleeanus NRRL 1555(-)]OAD65628.1 hypothetical protein PHYBLDRAFT_176016 [Phycomyces blakesleeanus NRRL 1555(-)]|eukprot:XP_018283668.1 hypothetical protein PHYBLDRAFT_176016 [Phycomyces blakesleeanus NRRL 1555(-)]